MEGNELPTISVVMPSLNVAKYIRPCIESVVGQAFADMEIIVVDAGSTDGTAEILKEYAEKYKRIKLIHSDIRSYGYQMNLGLKAAHGTYIGIVETDDIIKRDMYEKLYALVSKDKLDFAKGAADCFVDVNGAGLYTWRTQGVPPFFENGRTVNPSGAPQVLIYDVLHWLGLYNANFLQGIEFNETQGAAFQDQGFLFQTLSKAKRAIYINDTVYLYRQDNAGASIRNHKSFGFILNEYKLNERYIENLSDEWKSAFYIRLLAQCIGRMDEMASLGEYWNDAESDIEELCIMLRGARERGLMPVSLMPEYMQEVCDAFIDAPNALYASKASYVVQHRKEETKFVKKIENKDIVIAGAGKRGALLMLWLKKKYGKDVVAFCDNKYTDADNELYGIPAISMSVAAHKYVRALFVLTAKKFCDEMRNQLISLGVDERHIVEADIELNGSMLI